MDRTADDNATFILHTERTTISEGRYLVYYTFTRPIGETVECERAQDAVE